MLINFYPIIYNLIRCSEESFLSLCNPLQKTVYFDFIFSVFCRNSARGNGKKLFSFVYGAAKYSLKKASTHLDPVDLFTVEVVI